MHTWQITQKPAYVADFVELNKNLQQAVVTALRELDQGLPSPFLTDLTPLTGSEYKVQFPDWVNLPD